MRSNIKSEENFKIIDELEGRNNFYQIIEYKNLSGGKNEMSAVMLSFIKDANITLKQVRISLENSSIKMESGALHYSIGNIQMENSNGGVMGFGKKLLGGALTGETAFKPTYKGTGNIYLEPSLGHFALLELQNEEIVVDKGLFYACDSNIEVTPIMQKNVSSALLGGEGLFQTKIKGSGIVVLEIPVPQQEILKYQLNNEELKVDGNFALLRTSGVDFTVEKSTKSLIGTVTSGEGLLNVFRGTGEVWLAPTQSIYNKLQFGMYGLTNGVHSSNSRT